MGRADDILEELNEIGATGDKEPETPIERVEEVRVEKGSPPPALLDERGEKMVELADLVIGELDKLIESHEAMKKALTAMKTLWQPVEGEPAQEQGECEEGEVTEPEDPVQSEPEPVQEEELPETDEVPETGRGEPDAMGNISISVPPPVPLPPEGNE